MSVLRLALWQGVGVAGDLAQTLTETKRVIDMATSRGADLVVFPEGYLSGYYLPGLAPGRLPGIEDALSQIGTFAAQNGIAVVMGTHLDEETGLANAAVVFDTAGKEMGRYRKRALFGEWERETFRPGTLPLRFNCAGLTVGVAICYDVEFPELIRAEAMAGVDLVVVPTALMAPHDRIALQVVPTRAIENQIALGYANRTEQEGPYTFVGLSSIRAPDGEALAMAAAESELLIADIDKSSIEDERSKVSYIDVLKKLFPEM